MKKYPTVYIKLYKADGAYRVQSCLVWVDNSLAEFLGSREKYESRDAAIVEMKRRAMKELQEHGRTETEHEVNWEVDGE